MKFLVTSLVLLGFSYGAFAQSVVLNQSEMTLETNSLILEKTQSTPNFVVLNVLVPTTQEVCVRQEERQVFEANGAMCGYDLVERQDCNYTNYPYPGNGRVVVRRGGVRGPVGPGPVRVRRGGHIGVRVGFPAPVNRCRVYTERVPRSCYFMQNFCAEYETQTVSVYKKFNLEFVKFNKAGMINFSLDQYNNLVLDVTSMNANCIKKTVYKNGAEVTGVKLKLKARCR